MKIPVFSSNIRRREMDAVLTCMVEEKIGPGEINQKFIQLVKEYFNVDGAVALRSPSIALKFILKVLDLPKESGIMISALAPMWQLLAINELGYKPIILDVAADTCLVNTEIVQQGMKDGGRVLILHETMGLFPEINEILELNIPVIEDISQSAGGVYNEKKVGSYGMFSILGLEDRDLLTAGGGAVLLCPQRRDWIVLKKVIDESSITDILPDINSALGYIQLKELEKNEIIRKEMYGLYIKSVLQSRHKTFPRPDSDVTHTSIYGFPIVLTNGFKDVKLYAQKKDIEVELAFEKSIISYKQEELENCIQAKSLLLRCAMFPLYPRLGNAKASKIIKVITTLP